MKKTIILLLSALLVLTACTGGTAPKPPSDGRLNVISTIFPGYDFARAVGGENINLTMLLPPGSESHSFEPTPQDIIKIGNCDVFIYVGGESDSWVKGILASIDTSNIKVIAMMDVVDVVEEELKEGMESEHADGDDDHDDETEYDEHVWTSPRNAKRIVQKLGDTFSALDPENAAGYKQNAETYSGELDKLDSAFKDVVAQSRRKTLIFADRFPFRYFVDSYGLDYYAAFPGCSTESDTSAKTVTFLIDKVRAEGIPVVFFIEFSNERMADILCESTGARKRLLHSAHNLTKAEFESGTTYLDLMYQNVATLKEALL